MAVGTSTGGVGLQADWLSELAVTIAYELLCRGCPMGGAPFPQWDPAPAKTTF